MNVLVTELQTGTATDAGGQFRIPNVPPGSYTVEFSFVGYRTKTVPVDVQAGETTNLNIQMAPQAIGLENMVVTAMGEERTERSVSTAVQEVEGADLAEVDNENFVNSLEGRVSGVDIRTSSTMGGSSNIVIRGYSSLTGNNQPLIVIDGIPVDNSTNQNNTQNLSAGDQGQSGGAGGFDYGNAARTINPNNIESVSVLRGPSAAALYGSRGANGVIQITTKSGAGEEGIGVSFTSSVRASQPYELMEYQNQYGGGAEGNPFSTLDGDFRIDGSDDDLVVDMATDESWGPPLDGRQVREWFSFDNVNGLRGQTTPWDPHPDNIENFMSGDGLTFNNAIALSQGGDGYDYRLSLDQRSTESVFPNSSLDEYRFQVNGSADLSDKVTATGIATYNFTDAKGRIGTGYFCQVDGCIPGTNPFAQFNTFGQRQVELGPDSPMRDFQRPNGQQRGWNFLGVQGAREGVFNFTDNPYVARFANVQADDEQRIFGKAQISYDFLSNLSGAFMITNDHRTERRRERVAEVSVEDPERYRETFFETQEINTEIKFNYDRQLTETVSLSSFVAGRIRWETFEQNVQATQEGLAAPGLFNVENSIGRPAITDFFEQKQVNSLYGRATFGYDDMVYLTGTLRNDWASTLPADDNGFLYPSVQGSFVFTDLGYFQDQDVLSFGKVRASWAQVGNSADPFQLQATFPVNTPFEGQPLQQVDRTSPNPNLTREIKTGVEVGIDLRFFADRVNLNATYYDEETENQILEADISPTSGFRNAAINAGKITNAGVEASLTVTPIRTRDLQWDVTANWATNESEVEELAEGITTFELGEARFGPQVVAREGEPFGAFLGQKFIRDANGEIVYSRNGTPQVFSDQRIIGDFQPDWTGGLSTRLSYRGFSISALVDGQMGGDIWSLSNAFGTFSGLVEATVQDNQRQTGLMPGGVVLPEGVSNEDASTVEGIPYAEADGTAGRMGGSPFWKGFFGAGLDEAFLFDATHMKLREVSVSYTLPQRWLNRLPVQRATVSFTGRNLATLYKEVPNIDPSVTLSAGNVQGIEAGQIPPRRTFGAKLNLQF